MSSVIAKRIAKAAAAIVVVAFLFIFSFHVRDNLRVRMYGKSANEAYVVFYRPQPVYYRYDRRGAETLASIILEETSAHPEPRISLLVLVEVVFIGANGSPTLSCSLASPGGRLSVPRGSSMVDAVLDYWEQRLSEVETATRVSDAELEEVRAKLDKGTHIFLRRRRPL